MVFLGGIKILQRLHSTATGLSSFAEAHERLLNHRQVLLVRVIYPRPVLGAPIVPCRLTDVGRSPRKIGTAENQGEVFRVVDGPDRLGVPRIAQADVLIGGIFSRSIGIADLRLQNAVNRSDIFLGAPEAAAGG